MNRRAFLKVLGLTPLAAKALFEPAILGIVRRSEVTFPINYPEQFEVVFPDGTGFLFAGFVRSPSDLTMTPAHMQELIDMGCKEITVRPVGPVTIVQRTPTEQNKSEAIAAASSTVIVRNGVPITLQEITLPELTRTGEGWGEAIGLRRVGDITFTVNYGA